MKPLSGSEKDQAAVYWMSGWMLVVGGLSVGWLCIRKQSRPGINLNKLVFGNWFPIIPECPEITTRCSPYCVIYHREGRGRWFLQWLEAVQDPLV